MALTLNGSNNTIAGLAVGGLPDGIVDTDMIAANAVTAAKRGVGAILQVKQNSDTTTVGTLAMPTGNVNYSIPNLNVTITPASSSNKILISFQAYGEGDHPDHNYSFRVERAISGGATTNIQGLGSSNRIPTMAQLTMAFHGDDNDSTPSQTAVSNYLDSPSTTSAITYTVQVRTNADSKEWNYNKSNGDSNNSDYERGMSWITVMEVAG